MVAGLDAKQCGQILGKRAGAVRVAAMRGLRNLAAAIEPAAIEPAATEPDAAEPDASGPGGSDPEVSEVSESGTPVLDGAVRRIGRALPRAGVGVGVHGARR